MRNYVIKYHLFLEIFEDPVRKFLIVLPSEGLGIQMQLPPAVDEVGALGAPHCGDGVGELQTVLDLEFQAHEHDCQGVHLFGSRNFVRT